jgi:hypothetical protein
MKIKLKLNGKGKGRETRHSLRLSKMGFQNGPRIPFFPFLLWWNLRGFVFFLLFPFFLGICYLVDILTLNVFYSFFFYLPTVGVTTNGWTVFFSKRYDGGFAQRNCCDFPSEEDKQDTKSVLTE